MPRRRTAPKLRQLDLWGNPIKEAPKNVPAVLTYDFETQAVRLVTIDGQAWWVLADVARVLGFRSAFDAGRVLPDKHKGAHRMRTLGGSQELTVINEAGLYRLMMRSNKPEAERFRDWVTEEVLPSIRRTGSYVIPTDRMRSTMKRLGCDEITAKARLEQADENKKVHACLSKSGAKPGDFAATHNAVYRGQCGVDAARLRESLGHDRPLDRFASVPLTMNSHIKSMARKYCEDNAIPPAGQAAVYERFAESMTQEDLRRLGGGYMVGIVEDPDRGRIVDVFMPDVSLAG